MEKLTIRINFTEDILGSWPADPDVLTRFVSQKAPSPWLEMEEGDALPKRTQDSGFTVFPQDEHGIFLWNYHIKGFLKEAGNVLREHVGIKNLRSKVDNHIFVSPRKLYLHRGNNGKAGRILEPDDVLERPLRAQTAQGPRITLVGSERVFAPCYLDATIETIPHKEFGISLVKDLLEYGKYKGIGQWRNASWGVFTWEQRNGKAQ